MTRETPPFLRGCPQNDADPMVGTNSRPDKLNPAESLTAIPSKEMNVPDANRHGEPMCEWSELPVSGCAHCTGNDEMPEVLGVRSRPGTSGRLVSLDTYRGLPYYRSATSVPMPQHGPICVCGRPAGDAFVCPACTDLIEVHLGDVAALVEDLEVAAQRRDRVSVGQRPSRSAPEHERILDAWPGFMEGSIDPETRVSASLVASDAARRWLAVLGRVRPDKKAAADALDALHAELVSAVRALLEPIGQQYPGDPSTVGMSRWLLGKMAAIAFSPAGPDIAAGLAKAHRRAMRIIDNAAELVLYGYCETTLDDNEPCGEPIAVPRDQDTWTCRVCGTSHTAAELDEIRAERARGQNLTVRELAEVTGKKRQAVDMMLRRRGVASVGELIENGKVVRLYPASEILDAIRGVGA